MMATQLRSASNAPYLLAIVVYGLLELGLEDEAAEAMRVHQHKLSGKGRRDFKRLVKGKEGFVPRLISEGIDERDLDEVVKDLALMDELDDDDEHEDADEAEMESDQPPVIDEDFSALINALMEASHQWRSRDQLAEAFSLFFSAKESTHVQESKMEYFAEWYVYDYHPSSKKNHHRRIPEAARQPQPAPAGPAGSPVRRKVRPARSRAD